MQKNLLQSVTPELNATTLFGRLVDWFDRNDWHYDEHRGEEES
jgi:hypothetical protein